MSPAEIAWRLRHAALERCSALARRRTAARTTPAVLAGTGPVPRCAPVLVPAAGDRERLVERLRGRPAYVARVLREADRILAHRFRLLGHEASYGPDVAWCGDPRSGRPWPMVDSTRVPIFAGDRGAGDCKFVWELNRHQFLPVLAKAYCLSRNPAYAEAAVGLMRTWIAANPVGIGINWASGLEVAVRALAWASTYALLEDAEALEADRRLVLGALEQHGRHIARHLSYYFSPYNHLVGELTALYVVGCAFPWLPKARAWRETGWRDLVRVLPDQFHADGGSVEQSTAYHHFTLGFYLQAYLVRRSTGEPIPEAFVARLTRAFEFSMHLTRPDGELPMVGDADEARSIDVGQAALWDFRAHLAVAAGLFQRGDMKRVAGALADEALWHLGADAASRYEALETREPRPASRLLADSGYGVMRSAWARRAHYLLFDAGPLAAGVSGRDVPSAAHGHADALSIEVASHGEPVLVDPGFYTYNGDPAWHRYFRETAAHNTIVVDDRSQAEFRGRLTWSLAPRVTIERWASGRLADLMEASHGGYLRLRHPVLHRRSVLFVKPDYWIVRDELTGEGTHLIDQYFHLAPGVVLSESGGGMLRASTALGPGMAIVPLDRDTPEVDVQIGADAPAGGWVALGYEQRVPAYAVRWRTTTALPAVRHTLLVPLRAGEANPTIDALADGGCAIAISRGAGGRDVLVGAGLEAARSSPAGWWSDARLAWARLGRDGSVERCLMVDGTVLAHGGTPVLEVARSVGYAARLGGCDGVGVVEVSDAVRVVSPSTWPIRVLVPEDRVAERP